MNTIDNLIRSIIYKLIPNSITSSALWKGVFIISSGAFISQIISIITIPIITRLYSPSEFGILALFGALLGILIIFGSMRYEFAIPLPQKDQDAANIVFICIMLIITIWIIFSIIFLFFSSTILDYFQFNEIAPYLWLLMFGFLGAGFYNILNYWG